MTPSSQHWPHLAMPSDEESDVAEIISQPRKRPTIGKLCTADNTMVNEVTWPHGVIFTSEGKPAIYVELSSIYFIPGYLIL